MEVSCRPLDVYFRAAKGRGVPAERLAEGTGYALEHLRDKHQRITWGAFVVFMRNVGAVWTAEEIEDIGTAFFRSPFVRPFAVVARLLFDTLEFYRWVNRQGLGGGNQMVTCITPVHEELAVDRIRLTLQMHRGFAVSREFFLTSKGILREMPRLLGRPPSDVRLRVFDDRAVYDITFAQTNALLAKVRRALAWPFTARAAAKELADAHVELQKKYGELEEARGNLEQKVAERTAELEATTAHLADTVTRLELAQTVRERIFANISHEVRTPLSLVLLSIGAMRDAAMSPAERDRHLDVVQGNVRRLLALVDGMLLLAARQERKLVLRWAAHDVAALARATTELWRPAADKARIALLYAGPDALSAEVDADAFERALANLLSNAVKFTREQGRIVVEVIDGGEAFDVVVRDDGVGIDPALRARLFGRFEQGAAPARGGVRGSGLGLSIVKGIVEAHGGTVAVDAAGEQGGTMFRLTFPKRTAAAAPAAASETSGPFQATGPSSGASYGPATFGQGEALFPSTQSHVPGTAPQATVLVVEDEPMLRSSLEQLLATRYRVLSAVDGVEGLKVAAAQRPDLVVSDVGMPNMDGIELTKRLRALEGGGTTPVLLLTAFGDARNRLSGLSAGAIDYVVKPFDPDELLLRIKGLLAMRELTFRLHESEKLAALGMMSAGLAHELRNPANGIVNAMFPLREMLPPDVLAEGTPTRALLDVVERAAKDIASLSKNVLQLGREGALETSASDVASMIEDARFAVRDSLTDVRVDVDVAFDGPVRCAAPLVVHVVANLIQNGAHAAGPGGWVRVASRREGDMLVLDVEDSGSGVPPELRARIFEPFFTTKPPGKGTGLGLPTSRNVAERHGGSLRVVPTDRGTSFRLAIPVEGSST